ncbi:hypothetical protein [Corynebacterium matruchotii]|uniref:hypothetical protein n=1 Tax=Corynebacterium matruchotii TaxID=43768 RepID=UPI001FCA4827|nr:hypothetical protein [Corynebacterium matruchotii]
MVFFHYDKLITDVHQLVAPQIGKIKVEPDTITVEFAEFSPNYPREWHGDWEAITYKLKGDKLEQKTDPILDIRALDLDFGKNPPPSSHSVISPYGNVHQKPWDYEVKSGVLARVPMDDIQILCDIAHNLTRFTARTSRNPHGRSSPHPMMMRVPIVAMVTPTMPTLFSEPQTSSTRPFRSPAIPPPVSSLPTRR